jgi:hypothetical protein
MNRTECLDVVAQTTYGAAMRFLRLHVPDLKPPPWAGLDENTRGALHVAVEGVLAADAPPTSERPFSDLLEQASPLGLNLGGDLEQTARELDAVAPEFMALIFGVVKRTGKAVGLLEAV